VTGSGALLLLHTQSGSGLPCSKRKRLAPGRPCARGRGPRPAGRLSLIGKTNRYGDATPRHRPHDRRRALLLALMNGRWKWKPANGTGDESEVRRQAELSKS
jgi:hypothetical protein